MISLKDWISDLIKNEPDLSIRDNKIIRQYNSPGFQEDNQYFHNATIYDDCVIFPDGTKLSAADPDFSNKLGNKLGYVVTGNQTDSDSVILGSNPSIPANSE